jgi:hypothetical protein
MRRRMRLIAPHVRRAVLIGRVIDLKTAEAATFVDAADGLGAGMFFVDASARIVYANASGHAMLAQGSLLRVVDGKLVPNDASAEQALNEVYAMAERGDTAVGVKGIAVPLMALDGERHVAHVLPLTSGAPPGRHQLRGRLPCSCRRRRWTRLPRKRLSSSFTS